MVQTDGMKTFTRRATTGLLIAGTLAPTAAFAQQKKKRERPLKELPPPAYPNLALLLQDRLNAGLDRTCSGVFTVRSFDYRKSSGSSHMRAVVRLDWQPGWRMKPVVAVASSDNEAFVKIVDNSIALFNEAWPGCVI
jgi:hypothetical protein